MKKPITKTTQQAKKGAKKPKPKFIVVEGGEGSGKSSLLAVLGQALGERIFTTREPGGSPYAEVIRSAALKSPLAKTAPAETTLCLMFAARFDNVANGILPALASGKSVIADRFDGSSFAYQVGAQAEGSMARKSIEDLFWTLRGNLTVLPDMYVFIDVDPKEGVRRARSRNLAQAGGKAGENYDHFDDRAIDFHRKVKEGYERFLLRVPHVVIDANRPLEDVKKDFVGQMRKFLKL